MVMPFEPVPIIETAEFGKISAETACEQFKVNSQNDAAQLALAKDKVYKVCQSIDPYFCGFSFFLILFFHISLFHFSFQFSTCIDNIEEFFLKKNRLVFTVAFFLSATMLAKRSKLPRTRFATS